MPEIVHIASDHAGFELKILLVAHLAERGYKFKDHGADSLQSCDYPLYAQILCRAVLENGSRGILICGTGIGMSMAANRFCGIRAAVCSDEFSARAARRHNDANVLCLGSRVLGLGLACNVAEAFLGDSFEGGRHQRRIDLMDCDKEVSRLREHASKTDNGNNA